MKGSAAYITEETMWSDLAVFLDNQCKKRGLSWREASLGAGLDHGAISRFIRGTTPSPDSCQKLAAFFGVPEDVLLVLAGHKLISDGGPSKSKTTYIAEYLINQLPPDKQREALEIIRVMLRFHEEHMERIRDGPEQTDARSLPERASADDDAGDE